MERHVRGRAEVRTNKVRKRPGTRRSGRRVPWRRRKRIY
jgi:hypothetical protein